MAFINANPIANPELYDHIIVAGVTSPGLCTVSGFERAVDWDVKKGKGTSGATVTAQGEDVARGTVELQLWEERHFAEWESFREVLRRGQSVGKSPTALDVLHLHLAAIDVFSCVVGKIGVPEHKGRQMYAVKFELLEYRPPKPGGGTPKGSKPSVRQGTTTVEHVRGPAHEHPTAQDEQDKEIAALTAKAKGLGIV